MRAIDTNVLVRIIVRDDRHQVTAAEAFLANGAWVSLLAFAEAMRVLDAVYGLNPSQLCAAVAMLLRHESLTLQDADVIALALAHFQAKPSLGFSDCLILELARKAGHLPLGTFHRQLSRAEDAQKL